MIKNNIIRRSVSIASLALVVFAGCFYAESVKADTYDTLPAMDIRLNVIMGSEMGTEWNDLFYQGASEALQEETVKGDISGVTCADSSELAEALYWAGEGGCNAVVFCADVTDSMVRGEIDELKKYGVQVVCMGDPYNNGYTIMSPDDYGRALTESVIDKLALYAGGASWGDSFDFVRHLLRRISGVWETANSSGTRKQFIGSTVQEFGGYWDEPGNQILQRVSLVTSVENLYGADGGYSYDLNTGNKYYLYTDHPDDFLECHWDPDGYSGSDSLTRADMFFLTEEGNSTYLLDTGYGAEEVVSLTGTVSSFQGYYNENDSEYCYALNLYSPVRVRTSDGTDTLLYAIQLNGGSELTAYADTGERITIDGTYWEAHTAHHYTPVLLNADQIRGSEI